MKLYHPKVGHASRIIEAAGIVKKNFHKDLTPIAKLVVYLLQCDSLVHHDHFEMVDQVADFIDQLGAGVVFRGDDVLGTLLAQIIGQLVSGVRCEVNTS